MFDEMERSGERRRRVAENELRKERIAAGRTEVKLLDVPADAPLDPDLQFVWDAWSAHLRDSRLLTAMGGALPLLWSECSVWAADNGLTGEFKARFIRLVRALDRAYCDILNTSSSSGKTAG